MSETKRGGRVSEYTDHIKTAVTMRDVAARYGLKVNRNNKACCPFHDDHAASMHIYDGRHGWFCFTCGIGGDVIEFVQRLFDLSFKEAEQKLNEDFGLGLPMESKRTDAERAELAELIRQQQAARDAHEAEHDRLLTAYHAALDLFIAYDTAKEREAPENFLCDITEPYANACKFIDWAADRLDTAADELWRFEKGETN